MSITKHIDIVSTALLFIGGAVVFKNVGWVWGMDILVVGIGMKIVNSVRMYIKSKSA